MNRIILFSEDTKSAAKIIIQNRNIYYIFGNHGSVCTKRDRYRTNEIGKRNACEFNMRVGRHLHCKRGMIRWFLYACEIPTPSLIKQPLIPVTVCAAYVPRRFHCLKPLIRHYRTAGQTNLSQVHGAVTAFRSTSVVCVKSVLGTDRDTRSDFYNLAFHGLKLRLKVSRTSRRTARLVLCDHNDIDVTDWFWWGETKIQTAE